MSAPAPPYSRSAVERVVPGIADQQVGAVLAEEDVAFRSAPQRVAPVAAVEPVEALVAVEDVVARHAAERIVAAPAEERVAARSAEDRIRAVRRRRPRIWGRVRVGTRTADQMDDIAFARIEIPDLGPVLDIESVRARPAPQAVGAVAAVEHIVAPRAVEEVAAAPAPERVVAPVAQEGVVAAAAVQQVVAPSTLDIVVPGAAAAHVVGKAEIEHIVAAVGVDEVAAPLRRGETAVAAVAQVFEIAQPEVHGAALDAVQVLQRLFVERAGAVPVRRVVVRHHGVVRVVLVGRKIGRRRGVAGRVVRARVLEPQGMSDFVQV